MKLVDGKKLVDEFIKKYFREEQRQLSRPDLLWKSVSHVSVKGLYLEFGVWQGLSLNHLASIKRDKTFYGFDSFEGLPEDWSEFCPKGWMKVDKLPVVRKNVVLIKGLFQDTLEPFLEEHKDKVAFLHLDADLYSSTKYVLFALADKDRLQKGTVIEFDEVFYQDSPDTVLDDEHRVFNEFIKVYDVEFEWLWFFQLRQRPYTTRASLIIKEFRGKRK